VNTVFEQREADRMYQFLKYLAAVGPDGLIVQDFGVVKMVRDNFPGLKLHASTQMNIASAQGVNLLSRQGVSRVVLARELTLEEIRELRPQTNVELEVFVHGALCVSASGLCLFSSFLGGKSANRGMCTQACRRRYRREDDDGEGYFFSPSDLQLIEAVPDLADLGVNSIKIEGRMKSADYVGAVVSAYRRVIDGLAGDREAAIRDGVRILQNYFARQKTRFYFDKAPASLRSWSGDEVIDWLNPAQDGGTGLPLGAILRVRGAGDGLQGFIIPEGVRPRAGDSVRLHRADDSERKSHKVSAALEEGDGLWVSIPQGFRSGDSMYLIQTRGMSRRYPQVIGDLGAFKRSPGHETAPELTQPSLKKKELPTRPEGTYVQVSRNDDHDVVQSVRPARVMLNYTRKTAAYLLGTGKPPLPFTPAETILVLDPYFPQTMEPVLADEIPQLRELGYSQFVVNNLGHFAYFKDTSLPKEAKYRYDSRPPKPAVLIAGPCLYTFNRWDSAFVSSLGTDVQVTPLENNRQNLERTIVPGRRGFTLVTLFAYPSLFRIRADLGSIYDFTAFEDSRGERFALINDGTSSQVIPEQPFSIIDKLPFLEEAGFRRFILDLSGPAVKKKDYRTLMGALKAGLPLPDISRFNWKDGFFAPDPSAIPGKAARSEPVS
jgi:putative protease